MGYVCGVVKMMMRFLMICVLGLSMAQGRPYFNDLEAPESLKDILNIQKAVKAALPKIREATVCLQIGEGSGSGVIVSPEGLILTAAHVSGGVDKEITIVFEDGTKEKAKSLGLHSETDAAMVQLLGKGPYPFVEIEDKDLTKLGDWVISLGHSGGFDKDRGVVARVGRLVRTAETTVQSDCILIGGDSGGPLFDIEGKLIGIHSRVGASKEQSMHVPMRAFQSVWDEMLKGDFLGEGPFAQKKEKGSGFLGIGTEEKEGKLVVTMVLEGSTAEKMGLKEGDVLTHVNDLPIENKIQFRGAMGELAEGEKVKLKWLRGEKEMEKEEKLGTRE